MTLPRPTEVTFEASSLTTAAIPVAASPIAMFMFPPIAVQTVVPEMAWSLPSMLSLVPPPVGADVALADAVADAVPDALDAADELVLSVFFAPDEQPERPAMTIAAPPMATTNPRFTSVLVCVCVIRQDQRIIPASMGGQFNADMAIAEKLACAPADRCLRLMRRAASH